MISKILHSLHENVHSRRNIKKHLQVELNPTNLVFWTIETIESNYLLLNLSLLFILTRTSGTTSRTLCRVKSFLSSSSKCRKLPSKPKILRSGPSLKKMSLELHETAKIGMGRSRNRSLGCTESFFRFVIAIICWVYRFTHVLVDIFLTDRR